MIFSRSIAYFMASLSLATLPTPSFATPNIASRDWPLKTINATSFKPPFKDSSTKKPIIIAIIDTGIDDGHPFLKSMLWENPGETGTDSKGRDKATNNIDDDQNGFVDDVNGWNFVQSNTRLQDQHGHGTHVAGIIASVSSGQFPPAASETPLKLMILKYYSAQESPFATMNNTIQAIDYAVRNGAQIINYSGGGLNPNPAEKTALQKAAKAGVLVVAAAGNESANSDIVGYYPANYNLPNILSVGAINSKLQIIESSNYGFQNVDLVAPGEDIASSLPARAFGLMTGTSQATAYATAVAGMLLSERPTKLSPQKLIQHLTQTGAYSLTLKGKVKSESVLNAKRSLQIGFENEFADRNFIENYSPKTESFFTDLTEDTNEISASDFSWTQALQAELDSKNEVSTSFSIR